MLENIVFFELKHRNHDVYYHKETKECDFILRENNKTIATIQVCQHLATAEIQKREIEGLTEAMLRFSLKEGFILTEDEEGEKHINIENKK